MNNGKEEYMLCAIHTMQDATPGLTSYAGVTGRWGLLSRARIHHTLLSDKSA